MARAVLATPEIKRLVGSLERHAEFVDELIQLWDFGGDVDGADLQEMLHGRGLLKRVPFDPEKHVDVNGCLDPGDDFYVQTSDADEALSHFQADEEVKADAG